MIGKLRTLLAGPRLSRWPRLRTASSTRRYSVVSAVYDVAPYIDAFLRSLTRQSLDFDRHIELILVDDGSRDRSAEIIRGWQVAHPGIRYLRKQNGGQASARNVGLAHATGDWVTFVDPDDLVDARYFERVDTLLSRSDAGEIALVACKMMVFRQGRSIDEHALRTQFDGDRIVEGRSPVIQLSAASAFFRGDRLREQQALFDEALRPAFEDALFVGRYRTANPGPIGLCATAMYAYRKRDDASSTSDGSWSHAGRYDAVLQRGFLELLHTSAAASPDGRAPTWAQRTVLYEVIWYLRMLVDRPETIAFLTAAQKDQFRALLRECMARIDEATIVGFDLAGFTAEDEVGLLGTFKRSSPSVPRAIVDAYDEVKRTFRIRTFHSDARERVAFSLDGKNATPTVDKVRRRELLGETFVHERIAWIPAPVASSEVAVQVGDVEARIEIPGTSSASVRPTVGEIARRLASRSRDSGARWYDAAERQLATSPIGRRFYGDALLFMDRDTQADDNAEHLYRYVMRHRPDLRAFFVLRRTSHDWPRLEREGFRLIPFGSLQHRVALSNATHLISSHAEHFVLGWPTVRHRRELQRSRFTFLQHGVTKDDLSGWLNAKDIDCFVAASPAERTSIVESGSPYKLTEREVVLTGLPRHDALLARAQRPERALLIMPTWRQSLAGQTLGKTSARAVNPAFYESQFATRWKSLLHSPTLRSLAAQNGLRVLFFPHANLDPYLDWFEAPGFVERMSHREVRFQDALERASLMLTDYSSAAFEMAYLRRPVVYYQFDRELTFGGGHTTRRGYFDYDRDGFGPVCTDEAALLHELGRVLTTDGTPSPEHLARMDRALPLRDGRCSQRVLTAILDLDRPAAPGAL